MTTSSQKAGRQNEENEESTVNEDRFTTLEEHGSMELIRNIPNNITIDDISTKLPWSTIRTLPLLNSAWQRAVHNREVFEARVRSGLTEKLVVINHAVSEGIYGISLYSLRERTCFSLPPIPNVTTGIPESCQCITMDGKIFLLGGWENSTSQRGSKDVYMLDVAGQRKWKKCASMQEPRLSFGCAVLGGKIYVCGGFSGSEPISVTEAYDPKANAWTTLTPMGIGWMNHEVGAVNDELMVYKGRFSFQEVRYPYELNFEPRDRIYTCIIRADHVKFYNPVQDRWRDVRQPSSERIFLDSVYEGLFMASGKLHSINESEIFVYDFERDSRTHLHSMSMAPSLGSYFKYLPPESILAVDDELLAVDFRPQSSAVNRGEGPDACCVLLQSKGLGSKEKELVWERAGCSLSFLGCRPPFLRLLQL